MTQLTPSSQAALRLVNIESGQVIHFPTPHLQPLYIQQAGRMERPRIDSRLWTGRSRRLSLREWLFGPVRF